MAELAGKWLSLFSDFPLARQEIHQRSPHHAWAMLASLLPDEFPTQCSGLPGWPMPTSPPEQCKHVQGLPQQSWPWESNSADLRLWDWESATAGGLNYMVRTFPWQEKLDFQKDLSSLQESQNMFFKTVTRCLPPHDCRVIALLKIHEAPIYIFRCLNLSSVLTLCPPELKNNSA